MHGITLTADFRKSVIFLSFIKYANVNENNVIDIIGTAILDKTLAPDIAIIIAIQ